MSELIGRNLTVRELFTGRKYRLDYYQREYTWNKTNLEDLLNDLTNKFSSEFEDEYELKDIDSSRGYFLGPIVTGKINGHRSLVDGQQRLTTLTLLLIYLDNLWKNEDKSEDLSHLIFSSRLGVKTFNINVPERDEVMEALLVNNDFDTTDKSESVRKIYERYQDIPDMIKEELKKGDALVCFVHWLLERVVMVEIQTSDSDMAFEIFETMNDRGNPLSNIDMLKGYLLSKLDDPQIIMETNCSWRQRITELTDLYTNADSDFLKVWLRAHYADSISSRKKDAKPGDFDSIGTAFHRWIRDNRERIGLHRAEDYKTFINKDFERMSYRWKQYVRASWDITTGLENVFYNAKIGIGLQDLLIMATITPDDDNQTFISKANLVACYLDLFVARRILNSRNYGYSTVIYTMFNLAKDIRNLDLESVRDKLQQRVQDLPSFESINWFALQYHNRRRIHYILARMIAWIENQCGEGKSFSEYINHKDNKDPYQVEHIWASKFDAYRDEFDNEHEFYEQRNRFGGLLLLPRSFNASYGAKSYEEKLELYAIHAQNILARSLHPKTYENNPNFRSFLEKSGLPFKSYPDGFSKEDMQERQELYRLICERVWSPDRLLEPDTP